MVREVPEGTRKMKRVFSRHIKAATGKLTPAFHKEWGWVAAQGRREEGRMEQGGAVGGE